MYREVSRAQTLFVPEKKGEVEETYAVFYPSDGLLNAGFVDPSEAQELGTYGPTVDHPDFVGARVVKITIEVM